MALLFDILTLIGTIFVLTFVESALFTALAWAYHRYGEETEFGPLNFDRADQEAFRKYAFLVIPLMAIPTVPIHIIGWLIRHFWLPAHNGQWVNLALLTVLQFAILAFMIPIQFNNVEQRKATILAAMNAAVYALLYMLIVGDLLR